METKSRQTVNETEREKGSVYRQNTYTDIGLATVPDSGHILHSEYNMHTTRVAKQEPMKQNIVGMSKMYDTRQEQH